MLPRLIPLNLVHRLHGMGLWAVVSVFWLSPLTLLAQEGVLTWADKMLTTRAHDFGLAPTDVQSSHSIQITNIYKETVTLSQVTSSDTAITARVEKTVLPSRESTVLQLKLVGKDTTTPIQASVTLKMTFDGASFKTVTVPLSAFLEPGSKSAKPVAVRSGDNWAEQMFAELKYDFGSVAKGAEIKHVIDVTNPYKETVTLSGLWSSCPCISPQLDTFELKSKQTARLTLKLDTLHFSRKREVTVKVYATFDGLNLKQVTIPIQAYIRGDVVLEPGSVQFGLLSPGETAERKVRIRYAGRNNWTIRSARCGSVHLTPEIKEISRSGINVEYELLVKLAGTAPKGPLLDQVVLETDDLNNPTIPVLVDGTVDADLQITPEVVPFGSLKPGVPKVVKFVVKGRKPFRIEKVECDSDRECYDVAFPSVEQTVHVVSLTMNPPDEPGELKEKFTVSIVGRPMTLAFQATATIEAATPPTADVPKPVPGQSIPETLDKTPTDEETPSQPKP